MLLPCPGACAACPERPVVHARFDPSAMAKVAEVQKEETPEARSEQGGLPSMLLAQCASSKTTCSMNMITGEYHI